MGFCFFSELEVKRYCWAHCTTQKRIAAFSFSGKRISIAALQHHVCQMHQGGCGREGLQQCQVVVAAALLCSQAEGEVGVTACCEGEPMLENALVHSP